jgi:uncharacterized protein
MEFLEEFCTGNQIRGYGPEGIRVNDTVYTASMLLTATHLACYPDCPQWGDLSKLHDAILVLRPEVLIVGTGLQGHFPRAQELQFFIEHQIGYEFMRNDAACRTYNILLAEGRHVALLLFQGGNGAS